MQPLPRPMRLADRTISSPSLMVILSVNTKPTIRFLSVTVGALAHLVRMHAFRQRPAAKPRRHRAIVAGSLRIIQDSKITATFLPEELKVVEAGSSFPATAKGTSSSATGLTTEVYSPELQPHSGYWPAFDFGDSFVSTVEGDTSHVSSIFVEENKLAQSVISFHSTKSALRLFPSFL